jgi:hypothetical protein
MHFMPHFKSPCGFEKTPRTLPWVALLACALLAMPAQAQWTWRDKTGQVNASDRPPPREVPDKDILSRPAADHRRATATPASAASGNTAAASAPATALERELQARKRATEQEQAAKAKADEERTASQRAENCRNARSQIAALESGQRIARMNAQGEREVLDDRGRADEQRRAREAAAANCK